MKWSGRILLACLLILSVDLLAMAHYLGDPQWISSHLSAASGGDGILWQVQTTFLSVGFAGLAIAAQLFAEAPLAIGASRRRVLEYIGAERFVGVGLVANAVLGIETIWLSSGLGVLAVSLFWFVPTIYLLLKSTIKLMDLFGNPSQLDEVVRASLVESLSSRVEEVSRRYSRATQRLDGLAVSSKFFFDRMSSANTLRVPVRRDGFVIKAIEPSLVRQARDLLAPRAVSSRATRSENNGVYTPPQIIVDVEFGDRPRLGETAFRVITHEVLDGPRQSRITRLLQSSIEYETPDAVTPDEKTEREIASLQDAVGTSIRSGAFATAERAVRLLGEVLRGAWITRLEGSESSRRVLSTRQDWLLRSMGEVEQDAVLSPRAAGLFVGQAMTRTLEAPTTGLTEYVDECLRSFTRIWIGALQQPRTEFDQLPAQIVVNVHSLAAFSSSGLRADLSIRATWAMVELVKLALDAREHNVAVLAADGLRGLSKSSDHDGARTAHARAGRLVLAGWLEYLADKGDGRSPTDDGLRALLLPDGTRGEIVADRNLVELGNVPFIRWDLWEMRFSVTARSQFLELSHYIDRAQLSALALSHGALPPASDQQTASQYQRLLRLLDERNDELTAAETELKQKFVDEIARWDNAEDERLAAEPLSETKIQVLRTALTDTLDTDHRLATKILRVADVPGNVDVSQPVLWMNLRIPRHYFVDGVFKQTHADPKDLGQMIANAFTGGEDNKIVELLRSLQDDRQPPSVHAIREQIDGFGEEAAHYVLLTPYGGLDIDTWYSPEFSDKLGRVLHLETVALDEEAILFDRRTTLVSCRKPAEIEHLTPVGATSIALGLFNDVHDAEEEEPQVRLEAGEYFVVWPGDAPRVTLFGVDP